MNCVNCSRKSRRDGLCELHYNEMHLTSPLTKRSRTDCYVCAELVSKGEIDYYSQACTRGLCQKHAATTAMPAWFKDLPDDIERIKGLPSPVGSADEDENACSKPVLEHFAQRNVLEGQAAVAQYQVHQADRIVRELTFQTSSEGALWVARKKKEEARRTYVVTLHHVY